MKLFYILKCVLSKINFYTKILFYKTEMCFFAFKMMFSFENY